jgi:hypothetical protein
LSKGLIFNSQQGAYEKQLAHPCSGFHDSNDSNINFPNRPLPAFIALLLSAYRSREKSTRRGRRCGALPDYFQHEHTRYRLDMEKLSSSGRHGSKTGKSAQRNSFLEAPRALALIESARRFGNGGRLASTRRGPGDIRCDRWQP